MPGKRWVESSSPFRGSLCLPPSASSSDHDGGAPEYDRPPMGALIAHPGGGRAANGYGSGSFDDRIENARRSCTNQQVADTSGRKTADEDVGRTRAGDGPANVRDWHRHGSLHRANMHVGQASGHGHQQSPLLMN